MSRSHRSKWTDELVRRLGTRDETAKAIATEITGGMERELRGRIAAAEETLGQLAGDATAGRLPIGDLPALADRRITVEVRLIATKGEYASWRATRATGDFDLRTFSIRAYPVDKVPELRPGMSAYLDWRVRR